VIDARVLAIRTEVTAPLPGVDAPDQAPRAQALPLETVKVTPFIVGPDGPYEPEEFSPVWIACELSPGLGTLSCIDAATPIALPDLPECADVDLMTLLAGEDLPEFVSPCVLSRETAPEFVVPFAPSFFVGGSLELTMVAGTPGGTQSEACAEPFLNGDYALPDDCLYAVQRVNVGPIERLFLLASEFGMEIEGLELPDPESVPDGDRNPRITRLEFEITDAGGAVGPRTEIDPGGTIPAPPGSTVRVYTTSPEEDLQVYPVDVNNGESSEEKTETYEGDWYRTWGELLETGSDDPESYNDWILTPGRQDDGERPPDDRAFLYYVLRDGRQGVNWWTLALETPAPRPQP
jgi:hypothetical protein